MIRKFLNLEVQNILKQITGYDLQKVFRFRPIDQARPPKYIFLTDEDYKLALERSEKKAQYLLKMPPVMEPMKEQVQVLCKDEGLQGYVDMDGHSNYNLVFTDISSGNTDRSRIIAVREPDGTLRRANWSERKRMNQTYYPVKHRTLETPSMFMPEHLQQVLDRDDYFFVLERACLQFDPDEADYVRVTETTYDHLEQAGAFEKLQSTRHFGPLSFYLVRKKQISRLLQYMLQHKPLDDALALVRLYSLVHETDFAQYAPDSKDAEHKLNLSNELATLKKFLRIEKIANVGELELLIQKLAAQELLSAQNRQLQQN